MGLAHRTISGGFVKKIAFGLAALLVSVPTAWEPGRSFGKIDAMTVT